MRFIPIGRVLSPHGLRGEVKFRYYNETKEDFSSYASLFVKADNDYVELRPVRTTLRNGLFHIVFEGLDDVDKVKSLVNSELSVRESDLPPLPEGMYYDYQLVGLAVVDAAGRPVGTVARVYHTRGGDILGVVEGAAETLIPLSDDRIGEIDLDSLRVTLAAPTDAP